MTCDHARILILFSRPNGAKDLLPEDCEALARHLSECSACSASASAQQTWDKSLARQFQAVTPPQGLQERLLKSAYAAQGAALRKRIYMGLAGVALASFVLVAGFVIHRLTRPLLDTNRALEQFQTEQEQPEQASKNWLAAQGLPQHLPEPFDFRLLTARGYADLQGQHVPCLTFQVWRPGELRPDTARVYVVTAQNFQLNQLREGQNSFGTLRLINDESHGVAYVILHTVNLELFLKPNFRQVTRL